jgi:IclR helix-turn-helix domain
MKLEDVPRREEVLIVIEALKRLDRVIISEHFDRRVASFAEIAHVARAVWIGTLRGTPMTAEQISHMIGMPRATTGRKLDNLIKRGYVRQDGDTYLVADKVLATRTPALDRAIAVILEAADALRAARAAEQSTSV